MVPYWKVMVSILTGFLLISVAACTPEVLPQRNPTQAATALPATTLPATALPATASPVTASPVTATQPPAQGSLAGTSWTLVSYGAPDAQIPVVSGAAKTGMTFGADGQVNGSGGCNSFGGQYTVQGNTVAFQQVISTMMACADNNINRQEQQFLQALQTAGKFEIANGRLTIAYNNGQGVLTFTQGFSEGGATAPSPTAPTAASATATTGSTTGGENAPYLDDRSTPTGLIQSYFNAINRKEYLRAYAYWRDPAASAGPFSQFQQGYQNTASVDMTIGQIGGDAGAGQMYYSVPVFLKAKTTDGKTQNYAACYVLHLSQPAIQSQPPFNPLSMDRGSAKAVDANTSPADALAGACSGPDFPAGQPINPAPVTNTSGEHSETQQNFNK